MIRYECDRCGLGMRANDPMRYILRFEIYAAAGHIDLDAEDRTSPRSTLEGVLQELASADPDEIEDQTYRSLRFDLCDRCRRNVLCRPMGCSHCSSGPVVSHSRRAFAWSANGATTDR